MSTPGSETEIRERIAQQIRANPFIGTVHSRGRGAIDIPTLVRLLRHDDKTLRGVVVRPIGFLQEFDDTKLNVRKITLRYGMAFALTYNDDMKGTVYEAQITSTDFFSDLMIANTNALLNDYLSLGYDDTVVQHTFLQFQRDWDVISSEQFGKFHLALGVLSVDWWVPQPRCGVGTLNGFDYNFDFNLG